MVEYKLYILNDAGMITRGVWFEAASDANAAERARALAGASPIELWQGARQVEDQPTPVAA